MDLLTSAWIPVRADNGVGQLQRLTYEELLCGEGHWAISLPRDDFELSGLQLLTCITQIIFLPTDDARGPVEILLHRRFVRMQVGHAALPGVRVEGVVHARAPASTSGAAASARRAKTDNWCPPRSRWPAIWRPIAPSPMKPTLMVPPRPTGARRA